MCGICGPGGDGEAGVGDAVRLWGWGDGEMGRVVCDGRLFGVVEMIGRDAWGRAGVGGDGGAGDGGMWWGRGESWMAGDISRTARCIGMDGLLGDWGIRVDLRDSVNARGTRGLRDAEDW